MGEIATRDLTKVEAEELTADIQRSLAGLWELVKRAYEGRAWVAMSYESWDVYCKAEFSTGHLRLPREERKEVVASLREAGMSTRAIAAATGVAQQTVNRDLAATDSNESVAEVTGVNGKTYTPRGKDWPEDVEDYKPDHPRRAPTHTMTAEEKERLGKLAAESKAAHDHFEHTDPLLASNKVILPVLEARSQVSQSRAALDKIEASPEMLAEMREFAEQTLAALTDLISAIDNFGTQSARHLRAV